MTEFSLLSAVLIGLAGSVHCAGMCGGIVTSMTFMLPKSANKVPYMLSYNLGRITSYTVAGALAGLFGQVITTSPILNPQILPMLGGVMMILMGLYLANWLNVLTHLERIGSVVWKKISPISRRWVPFKHPIYAFPYGLVWGWLPCGLVYSTLTWSVASGSALSGALTMFCFGLGTLPAMLAMGMSADRIRGWLSLSATRYIIAVALITFGLVLSIQAIIHW